MPFLAVELDAVNAAPDMAQAGGISAEAGLAGLVRMWAWCFRKQVDQVEAAQVGGWFGGDPARVTAALVAFGFLAHRDAGWRVRGAHRYIRLAEARRRGGLAARSNLVPGARHRKPNSIGSSPEAAEKQPDVALGSGSALTPSTEHRAPKAEKKKLAGPAPADPPRAGWQALINRLTATYTRLMPGAPKYDFRGADAKALALMLDRGVSPDVLDGAWARSLGSEAFPKVRTLPELERNLNHFLGAARASQKRPEMEVGGGREKVAEETDMWEALRQTRKAEGMDP